MADDNDIRDQEVQEVYKKEDERLVDVSVQLEAKQRARARISRRIFVVALIVFIGTSLWAYQAYRNPFPLPSPDAKEVETIARASLADVADSLDAYRARNGALPESLRLLPDPPPATPYAQYAVQEGKYSLSLRISEKRTLVLREGDDKAAFLKGN